MSDVNDINITGRLTKDAVYRTFPSGKPYLTFTLANNTGYGEYASVQFFNCILTDKRADSLRNYLLKGKLIGVNGELNKNDWTNNSGNVVKDWQIKVNQLVLLGGSSNNKEEQELPYEEDNSLEKAASDKFNKAMRGRKTQSKEDVVF